MKQLLGMILFGLGLSACIGTPGQDPAPATPDTTEADVQIPPAMAPNTALVRARLVSFERTNAGVHCELAVEEVLETGAATRRPPVGSTLAARLGEGLAEDLEALAEALERADAPKRMTLRFQQGLALGSVPDWTVIAIHESED